MRGDGIIYQRGNRWWIAYYRDGTLIRESCGKDVKSKTDAKAALRQVHKEIREGTYLAPSQRHVTVDELLDDLIVRLKNDGAASVRKVESHLVAVRGALGHVRAVHLTTADLERYQRARLDAGRARATVNRECEALRQALLLAATVKPPKITAPLKVPMLKVQNARQGFLSWADFGALAGQLEDADVRDYLEWFWWTGMRPNEIRQLSWPMLDRETWTLNLDPKADKIGAGRVLAVDGPLREIIERRLKARLVGCALIFHRVSKGRAGQPVRDYRKAWANACKAAGLRAGRNVEDGITPYDLRRCAARNLVRGGTDYTVAMKITGHKTRSTFDRYNITSAEDVKAAIARTADYVATLPTEREHSQNVHSPAPRRKSR
jgi:integrase